MHNANPKQINYGIGQGSVNGQPFPRSAVQQHQPGAACVSSSDEGTSRTSTIVAVVAHVFEADRDPL